MIDKQYLIDFEKEIKTSFQNGEIRAPVHLSSNNEENLIEIFNNINKEDWVFSSWRNHYHALLHGVPRDFLLDLIVRGKSMSVYCKEPKFYSSAIVGGIIPIALGVAKSIKLKGEENKVWCFIGDMTFETGIFHESFKYAKNFNLPLKFVIEDNNLSINSPVDKIWGGKQEISEEVIYYQYKSKYPHYGTGKWVVF